MQITCKPVLQWFIINWLCHLIGCVSGCDYFIIIGPLWNHADDGLANKQETKLQSSCSWLQLLVGCWIGISWISRANHFVHIILCFVLSRQIPSKTIGSNFVDNRYVYTHEFYAWYPSRTSKFSTTIKFHSVWIGVSGLLHAYQPVL